MELRHLRYFVAVAEALNFTKASARLRVAQPALSRQMTDLEDEIGVDLMKRSPRGVTLTAEGKLFLDEVRELLKRADESVEKVRALARGDYGELDVGYAPSPTVEILPPALAAFQKAVPRVKVLLHDLASDELIAGLQNGTDHVGRAGCRTARRSPPQGLLRVLPHCRPRLRLRPRQTAHRGGVRQRQFADHRSGSRTRRRSIQHNFQTRGRQTPALPPTHRYDGSGVRGHRPCLKG